MGVIRASRNAIRILTQRRKDTKAEPKPEVSRLAGVELIVRSGNRIEAWLTWENFGPLSLGDEKYLFKLKN